MRLLLDEDLKEKFEAQYEAPKDIHLRKKTLDPGLMML